MATIGAINISLTTSTARFQAGLNLARRELLGFGTEASRAVTAASKFGSKLAGSLGGLGGLGAGLGLGAIAETAIEAETAMAKLAKVSDFSPEGLKGFKEELQGLSTELKGVDLDDIYRIATEGSKLGVASGDLLEYTRGIAKLSVALDDIPADVLTSQIGKVNVVFKLGVKGAQQLGSAIDKVADSGVSSAADILDVTQRISGVAAAAKIGAPDAIALAGALLDTGTNAEAAGTALNKLLQKLVIPESQAAFAEAMGISAEQFAAKVKAGPTAAILEFLRVVKGMDAASQIGVLQDVLGKKNVQQVAEIQKLAAVVETAGTYAQQAAHEFETLDNINKSYALNSETTAASLAQVANQFKILGDTIGSIFLPPLKTALAGVNALVGGLADLLALNQKIDAGVQKGAKTRVDAYIQSLKGDGKYVPPPGAKADAKAQARQALVARQAANEAAKAAAEGAAEGDEGPAARALSKKELAATAKAVALAATAPMKAQEEQARRAAELLRDARSPLEKYKDDLAEINKLLKDEVINQEQAAKLRAKLDKESNPFFEAGQAVGGVAAEAAAKAPELPERKLAGALELGSQEARSTLLDYRLKGQGKGREGMRDVAKATGDTAKNTGVMAQVLGKIATQLGSAANNFGTLQPIPIG